MVGMNVVLNILILLIILIVVKSNIDRNNSFYKVSYDGHDQLSLEVDKYVKADPREIVSRNLGMPNEEMFLIQDRSCGEGGSLENRKRLRWVIKRVESEVYKFLYKYVSSHSPYYVYIFLTSLLLLIALFVLGEVVTLKPLHYLTYVSGVMYVFQFQLSEISYTVLELFFISLALYASYKKNIVLLILVSVLAIHNRESGILLSFFWLIYNRSIVPVAASSFISVGVWLGVSNQDIVQCIFNSDFLLSSEPQVGQIGYWSIGDGSVSKTAFVRIIVEGYVIPIAVALLFYKTSSSGVKDKILAVFFVYVMMIVAATPLLHHSVKLMLLPFIILLISQNRSEYSK